MNKTEFVREVAQKTGLTVKDATAAVNAVLEVIGDTMAKHEKVEFTGFGTFSTTYREAREARNPRSGETMTVAAAHAVKFKPGKTLKDKANS